jgi:hypothetical protein
MGDDGANIPTHLRRYLAGAYCVSTPSLTLTPGDPEAALELPGLSLESPPTLNPPASINSLARSLAHSPPQPPQPPKDPEASGSLVDDPFAYLTCGELVGAVTI